ncbi:MAG: hypothetical protein RL551_1538, partial [Pseudomonadota bacterium]
YDRNAELAYKLQQEIEAKTQMRVMLSQSSPPDSPNVSYERNRVAVVVHSK